MTVLITLTTTGVDSGPFDLYSNLDFYTVPFATNISKAALQAGYTSAVVPDFTNTVRVVSTGTCINFVDIPLLLTSFPYTLSFGVDCPTACNLGSVTVFM